MTRSLSTLTMLVTATLFAGGLITVNSAAPASANETRATVQAKLAAHLAAAGIARDTDWNPAAGASDEEIISSPVPETAWEPPPATRLLGSDGTTSRAPAGTVAGAPGLGALPYFSFQDFPLTEDTVARVNLANGNLLITSADESIAGAGVGLRSDRFYNGLSTANGEFGGGWSSSLSTEQVGLHGAPATGTPTNQEFWGPSGFRVLFTWSGTKYVPAAGFKATLNVAASVPASTTATYYTLTYTTTGEVLRFNKVGWILSDRDRNGTGVTYAYPNGKYAPVVTDSAGRQITTTLDAGSSTLLATISDSAGRSTSYQRNASGQLSRVTKPDGEVTVYTYDSTGRLSTIVLGSGSNPKITFGYDTTHRLTSIAQTTKIDSTPGPDAVTTFAYASGLTTVTDPRTNAAKFAIDASGRVTSATDALGRKRAQTWTANSDVATTTDAFASGSTPGNVTTLSYDQLGNRTGATLPTGAASSAVYAQSTACPNAGTGNVNLPKCSTDDAGNKKSYSYDTAGNVTQVVDSTTGGTAAVTQKYTRDTTARTVCGGFAGQICTSTDGNNNVTSYNYDADGNLTKVTPPAPMGATTYTYDSIGRALTVTNGLGDTTRYRYDAADHLLSTKDANDRELLNFYTLVGAIEAICDGEVSCDFINRDSQGRTTYVERYTESPARDYTADYVYDLAGNLTQTTTPIGTTDRTYDAANQLTKVQEPGGTCPATGIPAANSGCITFEYNANAAETKRTYPAGATVTTTRDNSSRPTRITAKTGTGTTAVDIGYSYTAGGADRTAIQTRTAYQEQGITAGAVTAYSYDSLKRVVSAIEKSGATTTASWAYTYDKAGNRTKQVRAGTTGSAAGTISYSYNADNQLTSTTADIDTWTYDAAGNQTKSGLTGTPANYDYFGATTDISSTDFTYLGIGNSDRTVAGNRTFTTTALGLDSQTNGSTTLSFSYGGANTPLGYTGANSHYYITDHLGSVDGLFSATGTFEGGYSYSPYGEARATGTATAVTTNTQRYIGGYQEAANLYKLGARYYDATTGRFTQFDPAGQEATPYAYAGCNPVNAKDPSGLLTQSCTGALLFAGAAVIGLIIGTIVLPGGLASVGLGYGALITLGYILGVSGTVYSVGTALTDCFR
jgi:RHS repeat-associated protein